MEHGYLISVQAESRVDPEVVRLKLADTLKWVEGVGEVEVTYMGDISMTQEETTEDVIKAFEDAGAEVHTLRFDSTKENI